MTAELSSINAAIDVTGVMALKSEWPSSLWVIKRLSNRVWESKSVPPIETKLPLAYLMVNLPSLSDVVEFSLASQVQLLSSSIHTSAPELKYVLMKIVVGLVMLVKTLQHQIMKVNLPLNMPMVI